MSYSDYSSLFMTIMQFIAIIAVIILAVVVFSIVCMWKIFSKAGVAGWKAIIPIYNSYCLYSLAWEAKFFWITFAIGIVSAVVSVVTSSDNVVLLLINLCLSIASIVFYILLQIHLAKAFGQGGAFAVGLIILPIIFNAVLALSSMEYVNAKRPEDIEQQSAQNVCPDK